MNDNQVAIVMFVTGDVMSGRGLMSPGAPDVAGDHDDGLTSSPREQSGFSDCSSSRLSSWHVDNTQSQYTGDTWPEWTLQLSIQHSSNIGASNNFTSNEPEQYNV